MDKKPNLFVNKIDKKLNNNDRIYYSSENDKKVINNINKKNINLNQKINAIFTSSNYVYKAEVKIKFKDKEVVKKIVGKNQKHLITMANELIPISDIMDISINE